MVGADAVITAVGKGKKGSVAAFVKVVGGGRAATSVATGARGDDEWRERDIMQVGSILGCIASVGSAKVGEGGGPLSLLWGV